MSEPVIGQEIAVLVTNVNESSNDLKCSCHSQEDPAFVFTLAEGISLDPDGYCGIYVIGDVSHVTPGSVQVVRRLHNYNLGYPPGQISDQMYLYELVND